MTSAREVQTKAIEAYGTVFVVVPTYNESQNLPELCRAVRSRSPQANLIIVDDASPDGTGDLAEDMSSADERIRVVHRGSKQGYASALQDGMKAALVNGADIIITMDADLSHDPSALPSMLDALQSSDVAIGSRYVDGGRTVNWPWYRHAVSAAGNWLIRALLKITIRDCTGGFRAYRAEAIERTGLLSADSVGYAFGMESLCRCLAADMRVVEVPIVFTERRAGRSKLSLAIVWECLCRAFRLRATGRLR